MKHQAGVTLCRAEERRLFLKDAPLHSAFFVIPAKGKGILRNFEVFKARKL